MFRSALIEKLNKHVWLQYIFVILPVVIVLIYVSAYMTDMLGISQVFAVNDRITEQAYGRDELREVTDVVEEDGVIKSAYVSGNLDVVTTVEPEVVIFYVQMYDPEWYQIVTQAGPSTFMEQCSLFEVEEADTYTAIVKHDDYSWEVEYGDIICAVCIDKDGAYRVQFMEDEDAYYTLDELSMLELVSSNGGSYTVRVNANYAVDMETTEINFCTNLPTDNLYYNESTQSFVRNVSSDYALTFILKSNIIVVILSVIIYCMLLWRIEKEDKLSLLKNKYLLRADYFAACIPLLCAIFTVIML